MIHEFPLELKKRFLFFSTGSDRVPIKGLSNLNFVISRQGTDEERLPSAHTCFNHLLLPECAAATPPPCPLVLARPYPPARLTVPLDACWQVSP